MFACVFVFEFRYLFVSPVNQGGICQIGFRVPCCWLQLIQVPSQVPSWVPHVPGRLRSRLRKPCQFLSLLWHYFCQNTFWVAKGLLQGSSKNILKSYCSTPGYATWSDEDYIGKVSRTARTCHPMNQSLRCIEKCLGQYARQFQQLQF